MNLRFRQFSLSLYRMFPALAVLFVLLVTQGCPVASAQDRHFTLNSTQIIPLTNDLTGRDHELIVFLPNSYNDSTDKVYPVLYYMDGYWDTPLLNSIHGQLVYDNVIPELIMVGFSYPGKDANYGALRGGDLAPSSKNDDKKGAAAFLQFIEKSVIPFIESRYRADPAHRAISGNSLGGLFTVYAMYEKPGLFQRFIAISPAVGWGPQSLPARDEAYAAENSSMPARLFLSYGSDEYPPFRDPIIAFQDQLANRHYEGFALLNYKIDGERHSGVKSEGYSRGLRWVFKDIAPKGPSGLEREISGRH